MWDGVVDQADVVEVEASEGREKERMRRALITAVSHSLSALFILLNKDLVFLE